MSCSCFSYPSTSIGSFLKKYGTLVAISLLAVTVLLLQSCSTTPHQASVSGPVDKVLVEKSKRSMVLLSNGQVKKRFKVMLGQSPIGHKHREGDYRTPEGLYVLDWRKYNSNFYRAVHVSYPNEQDRLNSLMTGDNPGGLIMVHGLPNHVQSERVKNELLHLDWTNGCIALNNSDMDQFWNLVPYGTPIEIRP